MATESVDVKYSQTMLDVIREEEHYKPKMFLSSLGFPASSDPIQSTSFKFDIKKGKRRVAPVVRRSSDGVKVDERGFSTRTVTPPYINVFMEIDPEDMFLRQPGETPFNFGVSGQNYRAVKRGEYLMELIDMVHRRYEVMSSEALQSGKVTLLNTDEAVDQEIDFLRDAAHTVALTGTDAWDDAASDPVGDIKTWRTLIQKNSGLNPDILILGEEAINALLNNTKVQTLLDLRRFNNVAEINRYEMQEGVTSYGKIHGVEIVEYNDWYINSVGTEVPYIDTKGALMMVSGARSQSAMHFAAISDLDASFAPVPIFPKIWTNNRRTKEFIGLLSAPAPCLKRPETTLFAEVLE